MVSPLTCSLCTLLVAGVPPSAELDTFGVGVYGGGTLAFAGFPMAGPAIGVEARVRFADWISIEPHVDGLVAGFVLVGIASGQVGVPIVVEAVGEDGMRPHIGIGPVLATATPVGHVDGDEPTSMLVGGEIIGGVGIPLNEWLDLRLQLRSFMLVDVPIATPFFGAAATAGLMFTF